MLTLGIETSCDETAVSVTNGKKVLSNCVSSSVHLHALYGGVVPEIASRFHVEYILEVLSKALKDSDRALKDMRLVAVTNGPGLVGALLTGISLAKSISYSLNLPLIGVNHIHAHLNSAFLNDEDRPNFPFIGLVVSGGHTSLFFSEGVYRQTLLGQTQDDAVGEAYDKVAKILKLGYPGGPVIERRARLSKNRKKVIFPRTYLGKDSLDFSFSGIKTAVLYYVEKLRVTHYGLRVTEINDICYAFQEAALDVLVEKAFLAARIKDVKSIVVGGGVAANSRLRGKFYEAARFGKPVKVYFPKREYCLDNAAMVGVLGEELYKKGHRSDLYLSAEPNLNCGG
ncbi:MAG: tRNA (adenosine(37)-N6)-threonylcarbamoyltransferase complex transferase subunit TsaD [Candidatus Omnitrophica bacterium]|nr:tRNA (adenosine(37)-N6)-threonylcarbamoyltransferase complex transferase subunit TsaD [Candidatus Omnitrophota bacterium]